MYSHCLFCQSDLGRNERIDVFPVGATLAFDGERGRLWVVCPACRRWNLTLLEERWEAIEACERLFRGARLRVSTEQVGMARLPDGLDLIRIRRPLRPEMAAWRYGRALLERRGRGMAPLLGLGGTAAATAGTLATVGVAAMPLVVSVGLAGLLGTLILGGMGPDHALWGRTVDERLKDAAWSLRAPDGGPLALKGQLSSAQVRLNPAAPDGWELALHMWPEAYQGSTVRVRRDASPEEYGDAFRNHTHTLRGPDALHAAAVILRSANRFGASRRTLRAATAELERAPSAARYFATAEQRRAREGWAHSALWDMPAPMRLAMEMASHEGAERRAMEGDLAELETRWREAEEIAAVADRLAVPAATEARIARWRAGGRG
jgi:hypothetical protein